MSSPQPAHEPEPTPDQDDLTAQIAGLLLVSASAALTATAIFLLLRRRGRRVSQQAVTAALALATARTKHQPRMVGRSDVARAQRRMEAFYRAAYVDNASRRLQAAIDVEMREWDLTHPDVSRVDARRVEAERRALRPAVGRERSYEAAHERARKRRMDAAVAVAEAADQYGPELGWWAHDDDRTTPECRAADGSNFRADRPPIIGWPGTLHGGTCRCRPGPTHPDGPTTDEATGMAGLTRRTA